MLALRPSISLLAMASTSFVLQAPAPLQGVKSLKRPVFKVVSAETDCHSGQCKLPSLTLSLESRVVAVGDAASVVKPLLLRDQHPSGGTATVHDDLVVAHVGPHLVGDASATAQQHFAAVEAALSCRPQVIILDEALSTGGAGWATVFSEILRSAQLSSFRGAVVVCAREMLFSVRRVCCEQCVLKGGSLVQEEITGRSLDIVEDALALTTRVSEEAAAPQRRGRGGGRAAARQGAAGAQEAQVLLDQARELSQLEFEEDIIQRAQAEGWRVALLVECSQDRDTRSLRGYIAYKAMPPPRAEIHIARLAVLKKCRGRGLAKQLVKWLLADAARMPASQCRLVSCSAFLHVARFYESCGFQEAPRPADGAEDEATAEHSDDDSDPQCWMQRPNVSLVPDA